MFGPVVNYSLWITAFLLLATKDVGAQGGFRGGLGGGLPTNNGALGTGIDFGSLIQNALGAATSGLLSPQQGGNSPLNPNTLLGATNGVLTNLMGSSLPNLFQAMQNLLAKVLTTGGSTALTVLNSMTSGVFSRSCGPDGFHLGNFINTLTSGLLGGPDTVGVNSYSFSDLIKSAGNTASPSLASILGALPGGLGNVLNVGQAALANLLNSGFRPGMTNQPSPGASATGNGNGAAADPNLVPGSPFLKGGSLANLLNAFQNTLGSLGQTAANGGNGARGPMNGAGPFAGFPVSGSDPAGTGNNGIMPGQPGGAAGNPLGLGK